MLQHRKITVEFAYAAFQKMRSSGSRLPWNEVERMTRPDRELMES
jgi:hypothetical protein